MKSKNLDIFWRVAYRLYRGGRGKAIARVFEMLSFIIGSHAISAQIDIGNNTRFVHHGLGCVVNENCCFGENCVICQNTTFGIKNPGLDNIWDVPTLGDNVFVGAGAVLLGRITIGNGATIGANAVVLQDVPEKATVAGIPATIVKRG